MKPSDRLFYIDALKSEECICGKAKSRGKSFCWKCFKSLPGYLKQDLYSPVGQGYEEAYDSAVMILEGA